MNTRYLWRSLLSVFVLWFALSPVLCYASETVTTNSAIKYSISPLSIEQSEINNGQVQFTMGFGTNSGTTVYSISDYFTPPFNYDSSRGVSTSDYSVFSSYPSTYVANLYLANSNGTSLVDSGNSFDFVLSGLFFGSNLGYNWQVVNYGGGTGHISAYVDASSVSVATLSLLDSNWAIIGRMDITENLTFPTGPIAFSCTVPSDLVSSDVRFICVSLQLNGSSFTPDTSSINGFRGWNGNAAFNFGFSEGTLKIDIQSEDTGLLKGIIEWLKSIRNGITNVASSITELPGKIWSAIENGLKGLFVPSEQDMVEYKDKWDELLSQRFGVVYQSGTIITDTLGTITEQSAQGTINLPATTISFADTDFTFGGYDVPVVPQGFEWLVEIIKGLIDIVITVAFINAMRTKYDQLMRG